MPEEGFYTNSYSYWNTPNNTGVTRRQVEWAFENSIEPTLSEIAAQPCLGSKPPGCVNSCVTCEARNRLKEQNA